MNWDRIKAFAAQENLELAHGEESFGSDNSFELVILARVSGRSLGEKDKAHLCKSASEIKRNLQTVSAELDHKGPVRRLAYRVEIADIYARAGIRPIYMEELPNGYCSEPCCLNKPWFRVTSRIGHVVIGWRKSVISIDWKDSVIKDSGDVVFPHEATTRLDHGIHAWGGTKAAEYIRRLHEIADAEKNKALLGAGDITTAATTE